MFQLLSLSAQACNRTAKGELGSCVCLAQAQRAELRKLDSYLSSLYAAASRGTLFIVATCQGDTASVRLMNVWLCCAHMSSSAFQLLVHPSPPHDIGSAAVHWQHLGMLLPACPAACATQQCKAPAMHTPGCSLC